MRVIPLTNCTLFVLERVEKPDLIIFGTISDEDINYDLICRTNFGEIVIYNGSQIYDLDIINDKISKSDSGNVWRSINIQTSYNNYYRKIKSIMMGYIRQDKINKLIEKNDENEFLFA